MGKEAIAVHVIDPNGIYFADDFKTIFRARDSSLRREVREGRLKIARRCGKYVILGKWLVAWLEAGTVRRKTPVPVESGNGHAG